MINKCWHCSPFSSAQILPVKVPFHFFNFIFYWFICFQACSFSAVPFFSLLLFLTRSPYGKYAENIPQIYFKFVTKIVYLVREICGRILRSDSRIRPPRNNKQLFTTLSCYTRGVANDNSKNLRLYWFIVAFRSPSGHEHLHFIISLKFLSLSLPTLLRNSRRRRVSSSLMDFLAFLRLMDVKNENYISRFASRSSRRH